MAYGNSLCGASLISRWSILTSGHCVFGSDEAIVILGATNLNDPNEPRQVRFRTPSENYRIHPFFSEGIFNNDLAIVRFPFPLHMFTEAVNAVPFPEVGMDEIFANDAAIIMGFGRYSESEDFAYNLRFAEVTTMTQLACSLRPPLGSAVAIAANLHICTSGAFGRGICSGDAGSPLVIERADGYLLIGVGSFHAPDCTVGLPSVFTRLTNFAGWIAQNAE